MKAVVVYESLWGNTAGIARAIAAGIGGGKFGPLRDGEIERAREWGAGLARLLG